MDYKDIIEKGVDHIINWKWHKILTMDTGEHRERFLKDICQETPIIANYGKNQCSGIYIKDEGLPMPVSQEMNAYSLEIIFNNYYNFVIAKGIMTQIARQVAEPRVLESILANMKSKLDFEGNSLEELLIEIDNSLQLIRTSYKELSETGKMSHVYLDNLPVKIHIIDHLTECLHRCLGNDYANFSLVFDTDENLSILSKKAINSHIFARTMGYKMNVVCERKQTIHQSPINEKETFTINSPNWEVWQTLSGDYIENIHDYAQRDYTEEVRLIKAMTSPR